MGYSYSIALSVRLQNAYISLRTGLGGALIANKLYLLGSYSVRMSDHSSLPVSGWWADRACQATKAAAGDTSMTEDTSSTRTAPG
jgi:hypothetical protein